MHGGMVRQVVDSAWLALKPGWAAKDASANVQIARSFLQSRVSDLKVRPRLASLIARSSTLLHSCRVDTVALATWVCKTWTRKEMSGPAARAIQARLPTTDLKAVGSCAVTGSVLLRLAASRDLHGSDDPRVVTDIHGDGKIRRLEVLSTAKPKRALFDLADAKASKTYWMIRSPSGVEANSRSSTCVHSSATRSPVLSTGKYTAGKTREERRPASLATSTSLK